MPARRSCLRAFPVLASAAALAAALLFARPAWAVLAEAPGEEHLVIAVSVNGESRGELFLVRKDDAFWFGPDELKQLGLNLPHEQAVDVGGQPSVRIDQVEGIRASFDEGLLTLALEVDPRLFPAQNINVSGPQVLDITPAQGIAGYLNYSWSGERSSGMPSSNEVRLLANVATRNWFLRTEEVDTRTGATDFHYRVATTLERDWPSRMLRFVAGDVTAGAGQLSRTFDLGGISFGRGFDLRPGFVTNPTAQLAGISPSPGVAEIYVDGVRVATRDIGTGPFDLRNLSDFAGMRNIEVVIRDASGVRERIKLPYYFTTTLLARGLTDFNVSVGAERASAFSDTYAQGVFSAFIAHGFTDDFTAGAAVQSTSGYRFAGALLAARSSLFGAAELDVGSQRNGSASPVSAAILAWNYTNNTTTLRGLLRGYQRGYSTSGSAPSLGLQQVSREASLGWDQTLAPRIFGSITATDRRYFDDSSPTREYALSFSFGLFGNGSLLVSALQSRHGAVSTLSGTVLVSYNLDSERYVQATAQRDVTGKWDYTAQAVKNLPEGEGVGWRVAAESNDSTRTAQAGAAWRMPRGVLSAEARRIDTRGEGSINDLRASIEGALACIGSHCEATQPVTDAFALVDLSGVPDVRVYRNNQEIGHTGPDGQLFIATVPALTENVIRIADEDVPISMSVPTNTATLVPNAGTGHFVKFDLHPILAARGRLRWVSSDGPQFLENLEIAIQRRDHPERKARTGQGGFFEIDQLGPGGYQLVAQLGDGACHALFDIPRGGSPVKDLGVITCEIAANY
jgi:outer membrane usher protein